MACLISVITPCYNSGLYLMDALQSVTVTNRPDCEIIIVDDGSTDAYTIELLKNIEREGYTIIRQQNSGPAAARNAGARAAQGEFVLFLDSDNKIRHPYIEMAIDVMRKAEQIGVVYGNASFFGSKVVPRFTAQPFDSDKLLVGNYIDMCAVVRKSAWQAVGGFDEDRNLIGYEDWELWIRLDLAKWKFHFINEILYDYRVREDSLITTLKDDKKTKAIEYVVAKHATLYYSRYKYFNRLNNKFNQNPLLFFAKVLFSKFILRKKYLPN